MLVLCFNISQVYGCFLRAEKSAMAWRVYPSAKDICLDDAIDPSDVAVGTMKVISKSDLKEQWNIASMTKYSIKQILNKADPQ